AHLRTSVWKGVEIMEALRGHTTGLAVPTFVVDAPGGGGKIPLAPNYLVSASPGRIALRNYEGTLFSYSDGESAPTTLGLPATSVSDLLSSEGQHLIPRGQPHYERRETAALERSFAELAHSLTDNEE